MREGYALGAVSGMARLRAKVVVCLVFDRVRF